MPDDARVIDPPLSLLVFAEDTDLDDALEEAGFTRNSRDRLGIEDPYGTFTRAEKVRVGKFAGYVAFTHDGRVFSGAIGHWLLRELHGPIVAFECSGGSADVKVDCNDAIETITRSLKRE